MRPADLTRLLVAAIVIVIAAFALHRLCVIPFRDNLIMHDVEERMAVVRSVDATRALPLALKQARKGERRSRLAERLRA